MTPTKTQSLTLARDPVARMRELADLDNPPPPPSSALAPKALDGSDKAALQQANVATQQHSNVQAPPQRSAETQEHDNAGALKHESVEAQQRSNTETLQHKNVATRKRSNETSPPEPLLEENPVREAMRQALRQSYSPDLSKGPSTATTIRIPTEIWERLDMASRLEGQTKQDLIAEALKQYLKKIGRGEA
jgi:uncharacterized protein (DUF4415 family)